MQWTTSQPPQPPPTQKSSLNIIKCAWQETSEQQTQIKVSCKLLPFLCKEARHNGPRANPAEKHPLAEPIKTPNSRTPLTMPLSTHESLALPFLWTCWMKVKCYEIDSNFSLRGKKSQWKKSWCTVRLPQQAQTKQKQNRLCVLCLLSACFMLCIVVVMDELMCAMVNAEKLHLLASKERRCF